MQREQPILNNGTILRARYKIVGVLGKGGFSIVYKVSDLQNDGKLFALKMVTYPNKQELKRFTSERKILMQLDHPALPKVQDVFDDVKHNRACLVMNYVEGTNLEKLRRQQPEQRFSQTQVLHIMAPIMDAVAYLHRQVPPVIHRDIKSANIIVSEAEQGSVLVDFGISKIYDTEGTTAAIRFCTPGFSPPEQYTGGTEECSDIYGLAATMYLLLTGVVPVDALERMISILENETDRLVPINKLRPWLDSHVIESIQRALSLSKQARFSDVEQFWLALNGVVESPVLSRMGVESAGTSRMDVGNPLSSRMDVRNLISSRMDVGSPVSSLSDKEAQFIGSLPYSSIQDPPVAIVSVLPDRQRRNFQPKKRTIGALLVAALLFCFIGTGLLFSNSLFPGNHSAMQKSALSSKTTTSHGTNRTIRIGSNGSSTPFPTVVGPYDGMVDNLATNITTPMVLTVQQQNKGIIRGSFTGLQVKSSFSGTIDTAKNIKFTVAGFAGHTSLSFEGLMHSDGNVAGSFCSLDQSGKCSAYGIWSVNRTSSASTSTDLNDLALQPSHMISEEKTIV